MPNFPDQYSLSKSQVHCSLKLLVNPFLVNLIKKKKNVDKTRLSMPSLHKNPQNRISRLSKISNFLT